MKTRLFLLASLSALVMGGTMVGCAANGGHVASASSRDEAAGAKVAAADAGKAAKALARHDGMAAVPLAEAAVTLAPRDAGYRMLLGQSYLQAGRFASARAAFGDALTLQPDNGKAALNLALAAVATGDWAGARTTLSTHADIIPAADRGLALALAGDPQGAVQLLTQVARSSETSAKVRQNLALSLALGGQWEVARVVAAADLAPADVDKRMEQWAAFAQPKQASDQVAALIGVKPSVDPGQPVALALNKPVGPIAEAVVQTAAVDPAPAPAVKPAAAPTTVMAAAVPPSASVTAPVIRPAKGATKVALRQGPVTAGKADEKGSWFVQIGAFGSAGVARHAWGQAARRMPVLASRGPSATSFALNQRNVYRLSVGGFSRAKADTLCHGYRVKGGACFVRTVAGDQVAAWAKKPGVGLAHRAVKSPVQLASR